MTKQTKKSKSRHTTDKLEIKRWDVSIPDAILTIDGITPYEFTVFFVIKSYSSKEGTSFPSYDTIAENSKISRRKVIECVNKLVELGLIGKKVRMIEGQKENDSNLYTINDPYEVALVHNTHYPSAQDALPLVQDMHYPSAQHAPEVLPINSYQFNSNQERKKKEEDDDNAQAREPQTADNNYYLAWQQKAGILNLTPIQRQICDAYIDVDNCKPEMVCMAIEDAATSAKYSPFKWFEKRINSAIQAGCRTAAEYVVWKNKTEVNEFKQASGGGYQQNNRTYPNKNKLPSYGVTGLREKAAAENKDIYDLMREL